MSNVRDDLLTIQDDLSAVEKAARPIIARRPISLWRNRDFPWLWGGQAVSSIRTQVSLLSFPLLMFALSGVLLQVLSPVSTGLLLFLPQLVLAVAATLNSHVRHAGHAGLVFD